MESIRGGQCRNYAKSGKFCGVHKSQSGGTSNTHSIKYTFKGLNDHDRPTKNISRNVTEEIRGAIVMLLCMNGLMTEITTK